MIDRPRKVVINNRLFFDEIEPYLVEGREVVFFVKGGSMRPFLREGDRVVIRKPTAYRWKRGEVLLAKWKQQYVLHRLVKRDGALLGLAGDANFAQVEWVKKEDVMAVVLSAHRGDRQIWNAEAHISRLFGLCWYYLRPLRRVVAKVKKINTAR
ncbi:S24/S26 family peptidase [Sphingobacterium griseoflavum]|uniref:Peptidase S24/S26A/S26B/S26C domain-containing protein n=1 Tax=Sphingobacterium griseoflavum TaxID=1474952 RepID=A0ABQ3HZL9_9SPHI|nr:S24/S26 family peptidase [Sphingobacterium griseoflavum]GHE39816.1 hypothetical protein GCM10017764_23930 [Sphingobacterium griseoflavum]